MSGFEKILSFGPETHHANAVQQGDASVIRNMDDQHHFLYPSERQNLNLIIHSGSQPDIKFGPEKGSGNPFYDPTQSFDPKAQDVIDSIIKNHPDYLSDYKW